MKETFYILLFIFYFSALFIFSIFLICISLHLYNLLSICTILNNNIWKKGKKERDSSFSLFNSRFYQSYNSATNFCLQKYLQIFSTMLFLKLSLEYAVNFYRSFFQKSLSLMAPNIII